MSNARTVDLGGQPVEVQPITGRKAIRAGKIVREITRAWPTLAAQMATFERKFEDENAAVLERATARREFRPEPLTELRVVKDDNDQPKVIEGEGVLFERILVRNEAGEPVIGPDPLGHLTEADWEHSGQRLKIPRSPKREEKWLSIFEQAFEIVENQLLQLIALAVIDNEVLKTAAHGGGAEQVTMLLQEKGEELLDQGTLAELFELLIVTVEVCDQEVLAKLRQLGDRAGNALRLLQGKRQEQPASEEATTSRSSRLTSSTDSPTPTAGASPERSTEHDSAGSPSSAPASPEPTSTATG